MVDGQEVTLPRNISIFNKASKELSAQEWGWGLVWSGGHINAYLEKGLTAKAVSIPMTSTSCSQIICQKSVTVFSSGACVAIYHQILSPTDNYKEKYCFVNL